MSRTTSDEAMWRGSDRQIRWARDIRHESIRALRAALREVSDSRRRTLLRSGLRSMERIVSARWWIDNRDSDLTALARKAIDYEEESRSAGMAQEEGFDVTEGKEICI